MLPTQKTKPVTDIHEYTFLIYGNPKSGKSTLASCFPNALFFAFEPGHKFLEVYKMDMTTWDQVRQATAELIKKKDEVEFKTVIFDTADIAFQLCEKYVCKKLNIDHASDLGFGKGYARIRSEYHGLINALGQAGFGIVFISHAKEQEREIKNRKLSYTDSTLSGTATKVIHGLCDFIFFSFIDNDGRHLIRCRGNDHYNAGSRGNSRISLPEFLPNDFDAICKALKPKGDDDGK